MDASLLAATSALNTLCLLMRKNVACGFAKADGIEKDKER
jgi:hypothetical protein